VAWTPRVARYCLFSNECDERGSTKRTLLGSILRILAIRGRRMMLADARARSEGGGGARPPRRTKVATCVHFTNLLNEPATRARTPAFRVRLIEANERVLTDRGVSLTKPRPFEIFRQTRCRQRRIFPTGESRDLQTQRESHSRLSARS